MNRPKKNAILALSSVILALLVLYYKRPDAFTNSQFWAEDGAVFFEQAYHEGFSSLFRPYAGYFHLYPRLVFCLALFAGLPMTFMPYVSCYAWLFMFLLLVVYIWKRLQLDDFSKFFVVLTMVLVPLQAEIVMNVTNTQWIMALFPIVIFSSQNNGANTRWLWIDTLIIIMVGFTGPTAIILLPVLLFIDLMRKQRNRTRLLHLAIFAVCALTCVYSLVQHGSISRSEGAFRITNPGFIEHIYAQYGLIFLGVFAFDTPFALKCFFVVLLLVYCVYTLVGIARGKINNTFSLIAFLGSMVYLLTALISYRNDPGILHPHHGGVRNYYLPAVCCVWYFISMISSRSNAVPILTLLMLLFMCENIRCVGRERFTDQKWDHYAKKIRSADTLTIPINPAGWHVVIDNRSSKSGLRR